MTEPNALTATTEPSTTAKPISGVTPIEEVVPDACESCLNRAPRHKTMMGFVCSRRCFDRLWRARVVVPRQRFLAEHGTKEPARTGFATTSPTESAEVGGAA